MKRRNFIKGLLGTAVAAPVLAEAVKDDEFSLTSISHPEGFFVNNEAITSSGLAQLKPEGVEVVNDAVSPILRGSLTKMLREGRDELYGSSIEEFFEEVSEAINVN